MNSYLITSPDGVESKDAVTREDLVRARDAHGDVWIINVLNRTYFVPEFNEWMPIKA